MGSRSTARPNQSTQDIVLMVCGTLEGAMAFCRENDISLTQDPVVANEYKVPVVAAADERVLNDMDQQGIVIGTKGADHDAVPAVSGWHMLLAPRFAANAMPTGSPSLWRMELGEDGFINHNELAPVFEFPANPLKYQSKIDYEVANFPVGVIADPAVPSAKHLSWNTSAMTGGMRYLMWGPLAEDVVTSTWRDVMANEAIYSPLLWVDDTYVVAQLIPDIEIELMSIDEGIATLRLTWVHAPVPVPDVHIASFQWLGVADDGVAIPGFPNSIDLMLPAGVYSFGVLTHYINSSSSISWPDSYRSMVFEIY